VVLPGGGGVQLDVFYPAKNLAKVSEPSQGYLQVINPRGFRAYVCNEPKLSLLSLRATYLYAAMAGEPGTLGRGDGHQWSGRAVAAANAPADG
jgi:hypothetical protein